MTNFFAGIYRANDALTAARYGLEVTGQNIANANTPGYTRQRADQVAVGTAVGVPTLHSGTVDNGGVMANGAVRLNDAVLDTRARDEHAKQAQVDVTATRMSDIENIFHEPSDTGLAEQLHDFWNAWGDVANDPGAEVPREMLISSAEKAVTLLHAMDSALDSVAAAAKNSLDATAESVNSAAEELTDLNTKIAIGSATKTNVNALLDRRDVLIDQLSSAVGAKSTLNVNGTVSVTVGGAALVSTGAQGVPPFSSGSLAVTPDATTWTPADPVKLILSPAGGTADVTLVDSTAVDAGNNPAPINLLSDSTTSAELTALNSTVPLYRGKLDAVAQALANTVNAIQGGHTNTGAGDPIPTSGPGYDLHGSAGVAMFDDSAVAGSPGVTAKSISVAAGFTFDKVAASSTASASGNVDGGNALTAAGAGTFAGSPDSSYSALIGTLGRAAASAQQQQTTQRVITSSVATLQATASGVSFDEEVSNMLTYQMAFQASSRVLTTLDSMLDTLINRTGLVGR